jgi:hypothetical protein
VNVKRALFWLTVALVVLYVIRSPEHAAYVVRNAGGGLAVAGSSFVSFVGSVF